MLGPPNYETFVGLWMNRERTETRQAYRVLKAIRAAMPGSLVQKSWFDSLSESEAEAAAEFNRHQEIRSRNL